MCVYSRIDSISASTTKHGASIFLFNAHIIMSWKEIANHELVVSFAVWGKCIIAFMSSMYIAGPCNNTIMIHACMYMYVCTVSLKGNIALCHHIIAQLHELSIILHQYLCTISCIKKMYHLVYWLNQQFLKALVQIITQ